MAAAIFGRGLCRRYAQGPFLPRFPVLGPVRDQRFVVAMGDELMIAMPEVSREFLADLVDLA